MNQDAQNLIGNKTYFGLKICSNGNSIGVRESVIKRLPFYEFWLEKSLGSTQGVFVDESGKEIESEGLVYLHDWEKFCRIFINTGK